MRARFTQGSGSTTALAAPSSVSAGAATSTSLTFTWAASTEATSYGYQYKKSGDASWESEQPTNGQSATLTGLENNTAYDFQVRGRNAGGASAFTQGSGSTTALAAPSSVSAGAATSTSLTFTWGASAEATIYGHRYKKSSDTDWEAEHPTNGLSTTLTELENDTAYDFQVRNTNAGGASGFTQGSGSTTALAAPASVSVSVSVSGSTVTLRWDVVSEATAYEYQRKLSTESSWGDSVEVARSPAVITGLEIGLHQFQVRAKNTGGSSGWVSSREVNLALAAPSSVSVSVSDTTATLSWDAVSEATAYEYQRKLNTESSWGDSVEAASSPATITGLASGLTHEFQVRARNLGGHSGWVSSGEITLAPAAPSRLRVLAATTSTSLTFTWDASTGATSYGYQYKKASDASWEAEQTTRNPIETLTRLDNETAYDFQVRAINAGGASGFTQGSSSTTALAAPSSVSAGTATSTALTFTWGASTEATSYGYQYKKASDANWEAEQTTRNPIETLTRLDNETAYDFQVRAINAGGASAFTQGSGSTTALAAPSSVSAGAATTAALTFTWAASTGATSYDYQYKKSSDADWGAEQTTNGLSATLTGLDNETAYDFQVKASNAGGASGFTQGSGSTTALAAPSSVSAGAATSTALTFTWGASTGATSYGYQYKKSGDASWEAEQATNGLSATLTGLDNETAYDFQVRAINAGGASGFTQGSGSTMAFAAPASVSVGMSGTTATLRWDAVSEATAYEYQHRLSTELSWGDSVEVARPPVIIMGLASGQTHEFQVRAKNAGGSSGWVSSGEVTLAPAAPSSVSVSVSGTTATLRWDAVSGAMAYEYQRKLSTESSWSVSVGVVSARATITRLEAGLTYEFQVRAKNTGGRSGWVSSGEVTLAPAAPLSVSVIVETSTSLTFTWDASSGATIYKYQYKKASDASWEAEQTANGLSATLGGLENETAYDFQVKASNAGGSRGYRPVSGSTTALALPANVSVSVSETTATLSWDAVSEATAYEYQRKLSTESSWGDSVEVASSPAMITGLASGLTHEFQVRAKNTGGHSGWVAGGGVTVQPLAPEVSSGNIGMTAMAFRWDAVVGAEAYSYQFREQGTEEWSEEVVILDAEVIIEGLTANTAYEFQFRAIANGVESEWQQLSRTTIEAPSAPEPTPTPIPLVMSGKITIRNNTSSSNPARMVAVQMPNYRLTENSLVAEDGANLIICPENVRCWEKITAGGPLYPDSAVAPVPFQLGPRSSDIEDYIELSSDVDMLPAALPCKAVITRRYNNGTAQVCLSSGFDSTPYNFSGSLYFGNGQHPNNPTIYFLSPFQFRQINFSYKVFGGREPLEITWEYYNGQRWIEVSDALISDTSNGFDPGQSGNNTITLGGLRGWRKAPISYYPDVSATTLGTLKHFSAYALRGKWTLGSRIAPVPMHIDDLSIESEVWWVYAPVLAAGASITYDVIINRADFTLPLKAYIDSQGQVIVSGVIQTSSLQSPYTRSWQVAVGAFEGVPTPFPTATGSTSRLNPTGQTLFTTKRLITRFEDFQPYKPVTGNQTNRPKGLPKLHHALAYESEGDGGSFRLVWLYGDKPADSRGKPEDLVGRKVEWGTAPSSAIAPGDYAVLYEYDGRLLLSSTPSAAASARIYDIPASEAAPSKAYLNLAGEEKAHYSVEYVPTRVVPTPAASDTPHPPAVYGMNFPYWDGGSTPSIYGSNDLGFGFLYLRKIIIDGGSDDDLVITAQNINDTGGLWSALELVNDDYEINVHSWRTFQPTFNPPAPVNQGAFLGPAAPTTQFAGVNDLPTSLPGAGFINAASLVAGIPARFIWITFSFGIAIVAMAGVQRLMNNIIYTCFAGGVVLSALCAPAVGLVTIWVLIFYAIMCACVIVIGRRLSAGI